jgi:preprotein translocase subunit SecF
MDLIRHDTNFDFLGKRRILIPISVAVVALLLLAVPFRTNVGVDFAGGTEIEVKFGNKVTAEEVRQRIANAGFVGASVQQYGPESDNSYLVRVERISILTPEQAEGLRKSLTGALASYDLLGIDFDANVGDRVDVRTGKPVPLDVLRQAATSVGVKLNNGEAVRDLTRGTNYSYEVLTQPLAEKVSEALHTAFGKEQVEVRRVEYVGPQVGEQLRNRGIMAVLLSMLAMAIYIAFRFQPKFAPGAVVSLVHDVAVVMGYYVVTGREFNLTSIAVLLTIVGYSINDTIVVYDRVRELEARKTGRSLEQLINDATNQCLSRTFITSGVTALSLIGLLIYGVGSIQDFAGAMMVGIVTGTYSSIYVAGPFAIWTDRWMKAREKKALTARTTSPKSTGGGAPAKATGGGRR